MMVILAEMFSELTDFLGWVEFILISLCFARLLARSAALRPYLWPLLDNHKRLGWFTLAFGACHGLIAYFQEGPELGEGLKMLYSELGTGLLTGAILLVTCLATLVVAPRQFRNRHILLVASVAVFGLLHIQ